MNTQNKAIVVCMHKYTPFGGEYYEPIYNYFIGQTTKFRNEFDKLYLVDSNWEIKNAPDFAEVIRVNPNLRYYEAYKEILPQIKEDLVLFLDNDTVIYRKGIIDKIFKQLDNFDVVSIYDNCGTYKTDKLNAKNKFTPYLFAIRKELLMKYRDVEWGPAMPEHETLGKLTQVMLEDGLNPYEMEEDKNSIYFDGIEDGEKGKDLGYYHIRSGSVPAYLLATKHYGNPQTYWDYLENQPQREYLRQICWYNYMGGDAGEVTFDLGLSYKDFWVDYFNKFKEYHNLPWRKQFLIL